MVVTVSLWIDQLLNSVIGDLADFQKLYKVSSIVTLVVSFHDQTLPGTLIVFFSSFWCLG
jgi:hypothetical protein